MELLESSHVRPRPATRLRYAPTVTALFILKHFPTLLQIYSLLNSTSLLSQNAGQVKNISCDAHICLTEGGHFLELESNRVCDASVLIVTGSFRTDESSVLIGGGLANLHLI
jgi:hypothetical protein